MAVSLACYLAVLLVGCPEPPSNLDDFIEFEMARAGIAGLSACIVKGDQVVWANGYGWANIEEERPVTPDTLFQIASISKTVVGVAVLQLFEDGLIGLDDDVNDYLPFAVRNPWYPEEAITFRMILTHRSSINDNLAAMVNLYEWDADSPISLEELVRGMLTPEGEWYSKCRCFGDYAPGEEYAYSNIAFALLGYLVQVISGTPFDQYCNANIFTPLGMNETRWFLRDLDPTHIAMPYAGTGRFLSRFEPYGQYGYPDYPSGQIRSSVMQFARFLAMMMNGGSYEGVRILKPETVDEMLRIQFEDEDMEQALVWYRVIRANNRLVYAHSGGEQGVITDCFFERYDEPVAIAVFTNGDTDILEMLLAPRVNAIATIENRLYEEAEKY